MSHPRFKRIKRRNADYILPGHVRIAITDKIKHLVMDSTPELVVGAMIADLEIQFGVDAIAAYREEVI